MRTSTAAMMHALAAPCSQHGLDEEQSNLQYRAGGSKSFPYWQHVNPPRSPNTSTLVRHNISLTLREACFHFFPPSPFKLLSGCVLVQPWEGIAVPDVWRNCEQTWFLPVKVQLMHTLPLTNGFATLIWISIPGHQQVSQASSPS